MTKYMGKFAHWVEWRRWQLRWNKHTLALKAGIDPSYVALVEKGPNIPSRRVVQALGKAVGREVECMVYAGYIPADTPEKRLKQIIQLLLGHPQDALVDVPVDTDDAG